jgi:uncharacterized repeat protein (TIGR01451 family)
MSRGTKRAGLVVAGALGAAMLWAAPASAATADLSIQKTDDADPVAVGSVLTYTITATNAGPEEATSVEVEDQLPNQLDVVSATASAGTCDRNGRRVTCAIGALATGADATVTIRVRPRADGQMTNTATVRTPDTDPVEANNTDAETTTVVKPPREATCAGRTATVIGTGAAETLVGTGGRDVFAGLGGNDLIRGLAGRDVVCGAGGNDRIRGGDGRDLLRGGAGRDRINGGSGRDRLRGGGGNDVCRGGPGREGKRSC